MATEQAGPGRPRNNAINDAVIDAAIDALRTLTYAQLSISDLADRAHVSRNAIYRRWSTKAEIVLDAVVIAVSADAVPDTGSFRSDLVALTNMNVDLFQGEARNLFIAGLAAAGEIGHGFGGVDQPRLRHIEQIWERAAARGDLPDGLSPVVATGLLTGGALFAAVVLGTEITEVDVSAMVDTVLGQPGRRHETEHP